MRLDWKYVIGIAVALAGVATPIYLWQFDLKAKSINVKILSSVALQTPLAEAVPEIQISVDGKTVASPVLTVLEISNAGSKPIPSSDFESPLEIILEGDSTLIRATLQGAKPLSLKPEIEVSKQSAKLKPLLLNVGDTIKLHIISSGKKPIFSTAARIAGVSEVLVDASNLEVKRHSWYVYLASSVLLTTLLGIYSVLYSRSLDTNNLPHTVLFLLTLIIVEMAILTQDKEYLLGFENTYRNLFAMGMIAFVGVIGLLTYKLDKRFNLVGNNQKLSVLRTNSES